MAIVQTYYFQLRGAAPDAVWFGSRDGSPSSYRTPDNDYVQFDMERDATDLGVRIENLCDVRIRVRFKPVEHERHGLIFEIGPGRANTEFWDVRSLPDNGLTWAIDGWYLVSPGDEFAFSTGSGDADDLGGKYTKIHDPTFKITKGGGG